MEQGKKFQTIKQNEVCGLRKMLSIFLNNGISKEKIVKKFEQEFIKGTLQF
jgi:sRNA-binding regulator protein Hfq